MLPWSASNSVSVGTTTFGTWTTPGPRIETVPFGACGSYAFRATRNLDSPHRVFDFCFPVEVSMDNGVLSSSADVQHSIAAAFALEPRQVGVQGVSEGASGLSANFRVTSIG